MGGKRRDKTTGLPLPSPVVPPTSICLRILVPNALEYRSALKGVLSELGKSWTWSQTVGEDNQGAIAAAELWRERIEDAFYEMGCTDVVTCDDITDCITNNAGTRAAVGAIVPTVPIEGRVFPPGAPLTPSQMTQRLNEIDACAFDPYWAQVEQYVDYMVDLGQDVLDQLAAYSAALDAGENVPMGQFLGKLKNSSTAGKVIDFLQWALVTVKAAYEAADNTANRDAIKCAIFCEFRDDCLITIQGTLDTLNARNGGLLTPTDLDNLPALVDAFTAAAFNPALALDLWILFLMGSAKTAGMFGLQGIDETLQLVLATAVNDANNDWEIKCEECDEPPPPDPYCVDFTATQGTWDVDGGNGSYETGQGFKGLYYPGFLTTFLYITRASAGDTIEKVVIRLNEGVTDLTLSNADGSSPYTYSGSPSTEIEFSAATFPGTWANKNGALGLDVRSVQSGDRASLRIIEACVYPV